MAECYIVVKVTRDVVNPTPIEEKTLINIDCGTLEYTDIPETGKEFKVDWKDINTAIIAELGMTFEEFIDAYDVDNAKVYYKSEDAVDFSEDKVDGISHNVEGLEANPETNTSAVSIIINNLIDESTYGVVKVVIPSKDASKLEHGDVAIEFAYEIKHDHVWPELNPDYLIDENTIVANGYLESGKWVLKSNAKEHFENYLDGYENPNNHGDLFIELRDVNGKPQTGATIAGDTYNRVWFEDHGAYVELTTPLTTDSKEYVITLCQNLKNGNVCTTEYNLMFENPFKLVSKAVSLQDGTKASTTDVKDVLTVEDIEGNEIYNFATGTVTEEAAEYGLTAYDFTAITYGLAYDDPEHPEASFGGNLTLTGSEYTWYNDGAALARDKKAFYTVSVTIGNICTLTGKNEIVIKK